MAGGGRSRTSWRRTRGRAASARSCRSSSARSAPPRSFFFLSRCSPHFTLGPCSPSYSRFACAKEVNFLQNARTNHFETLPKNILNIFELFPNEGRATFGKIRLHVAAGRSFPVPAASWAPLVAADVRFGQARAERGDGGPRVGGARQKRPSIH